MSRHLAHLAVLVILGSVSTRAAEPAAGPAAEPAAEPGSNQAVGWETRLRQLEAEHLRQASAWETAILQAAAPALRDSLEALVPARKQAQRREWLSLRLEQERARGDLGRIARLKAELARVEPPVAPAATSFVPRDSQGQGGAR